MNQFGMRTLGATMLVLSIVAPARAASVPLFTASGYMVGLPFFPQGTTTLADMNGDGMADLVLGLDAGNGIAVALARGGGQFAPFTLSFPGHGVLFTRTGDLDGDGRMDVAGTGFALGEPDSAIAFVLYGDGNGGWSDSAQVRTPVTAGEGLADLDGDGRPELIASLMDSSFAVYRAKPDRSLEFLGRYSTPGLAGTFASGDVTGSPATDLVVTGDWPGVSVFPGAGDGTLGPRADQAYAFSGGFSALGAIDAQPGLDLVYGLSFGSGLGNGVFSALSNLPSSGTVGVLGLEDLDHDGNLDVLSVNGPASVRGVVTWLGNGAGGFGPRILSGRSIFSPRFPGIGDVDEDGNLDVAYAGSFSDHVIVTMGNGDGTFGQRGSPPDIAATFSGLAAGDFDEDGRQDGIAMNTLDHHLAFARGRGDGSFDPFVVSATTTPSYSRLFAGYFDADTHLDLVGVSTASSLVSFLKGHGDGTFDAPANFSLPSAPGLPTVADVDADGRPDVVVPCTASNVLATLRSGPAGLLAPVLSATSAGPYAAALADLNADTRIDRVLSCASQVVVQLDDGAGGWTTIQSTPMSPAPGDLILADLDEDGRLDLAVAQGQGSIPQPALVHVFHGAPGGTFDSESIANLDWYLPSITEAHPGIFQLFARDLDNDGHFDLLGRSSLSAAIVARGHGDRTFGQPEAYASPYGSAGMALADLNGDSFVDVIGAGSSGGFGSVVALMNRSGGVTGVPPGPRPTAGVQLAISSLAPNPSRGAFALDVRALRARTARIALYSPSGRVVYERAGIALAPGANHVALDAGRALAPGVYWVHVHDGAASAVRKAVVLP
jgi:hypothetical protein